MPEERSGKRRRRRRRRRGGGGGGAAAGETDGEEGTRAAPQIPNWQWRTFPVFFAFVLGMLLMAISFGFPSLGMALFFISMAGVAFGLAHILTRQVIARWRR